MNAHTSNQTLRHRWALGAIATLGLLAALPAAADNSSSAARDIGTDPVNYQRREVVGVSDPMDFYKFTLTDRHSVNISLTGLSGDADLYLMGDNGTWLRSNNRGRGIDERINRNLDAGSYRLLVFGWEGTVNHTLRVNTQLANPPGITAGPLGIIDGMGGTRASAVALGTIAPSTGWIDYHFRLPGPRIIDITGTGNVAAAVTPDTTPVRWSVLQGNAISGLRLNAGRHYLRVFRNPSSSEAFRFTITARPHFTDDRAGNTTATARNLGAVGNPPVYIDDYVGQHDYDDYYRVYVGPNRQLNVALVHRQGGQGANVLVIDTLGNVVRQSTNRGNAPENISFNVLAAGVHYVRVSTDNRSGGGEALYTIAIGTVPASGNLPPSPTPAPAPGTPDSSDDPDTPGFFGRVAPGLVPGVTMGSLSHSESIGGSTDFADFLSFRVGCGNTSDAPIFNVSAPPPGVMYGLVEVTPNGTMTRNPAGTIVTNGSGQLNYEFILGVSSPSGALVNYTATVTQTGCQ
ncbi:MAG: pre-peptidase C-terminal domain-containing protein [Pseudomonadota bacterium]